jgi:hypothetical protein
MAPPPLTPRVMLSTLIDVPTTAEAWKLPLSRFQPP